MSEWWTYRLSDFLMFSPRSYWRLVEAYNRELWPGPAVAFLVGLVALWLAWRSTRKRVRLLALLLAGAWAWVAYAFHLQRYSTIFLGATYLAYAFAVQAVVFLWAASAPPNDLGQRRRTGLLLAAAGVLLPPLLPLVFARPWQQAEVFAWMPDPTAVATLGLVIATGMRARGIPTWLLALLPLAATILAILTAWLFISPFETPNWFNPLYLIATSD